MESPSDKPARPTTPADAPVTLADVAGHRVASLAAASLPLYGVGLVVSHGVARWLILLAALTILASLVFSPGRAVKRHEAPATVLMAMGVICLWSWAMPADGLTLTMGLAATMVYMGLMVPRPYAEIGIGSVAGAYFGSLLAFGPSGMILPVTGATVSALALGGLMLRIRLTTERRVNQHVGVFADHNVQLERLSVIDPLTGLVNRRRMQTSLTEIWERAEETGGPVSFIMIDIDYFKQYNDHFGHLGGDDCLQLVATTLASNARAADTVARFGGEEFAVVMPDADLECARSVAERVREAVAALHAPHPGSSKGFVTVSAGVASTVPGQAGLTEPAGLDGLLNQADRCLYEAKRRGRDQVVTATSLSDGLAGNMSSN
ncbi:MAG: diguanylate cyclase [Actinomycetota bacterium]|nr:diguanylate cyclase [Actinomycetota bacterium]